MEATDEELYHRMKNGDREAFQELHDRREPGLFRYALHMTGSREIAEETTQEAFLSLIQPESRFNPSLGFVQAYLYGAVRNLIREYRRRPAAEPERDVATQDDVLGTLIGDEMTAALHSAVLELPETFRDVIVLCDLEERSYEDAARIMQCPIGTVRSRLHRARSMLAAKLKSQPTSLTARCPA